MMSERIYLNNDWKFAEQFEASMTEAAYDDSVMQNVRLPHTCKETPLHYFDEHCYQMVSGYRRVIEAEEAWKGKKILLTIDGAAHDSEVFLKILPAIRLVSGFSFSSISTRAPSR